MPSLSQPSNAVSNRPRAAGSDRGRVAAARAGDRLRRRRAGEPRPVHRQRRAAADGGDFHVGADGLADLSWVLNAYAIVYAALLVLFGRLADRYRRERGFLLGVAVFVAASAACGAATSLPMLVAFRIVQAAGAALLTPTSLGLMLATTTPERRHGAVRTWAAVGGIAAALGPGSRRPAGRRELALGVPGQRADRPARAARRLAAAAGGARPPGPGARRARRGADHRRHRRADAWPGQGRILGMGQRRDDRACWR